MGYKIVRSYAKINLSLKVTGTRKDGYHDLDMVMLPINAHDTIIINPLKEAKDHFITMDDFSVINIEDNTVTKALNKITDFLHSDKKFRMDIHKAIPSKGGLGGGSSNAAFTLKGINSFYKNAVSHDDLFEMSKTLGSDVPFFIDCKPARCQGTGDIMTPINIKNNYYVLIVKPENGCSTASVFKAMDEKTVHDKTIDDVVEALESGDDEKLAASVFNDLEGPAMEFVPEIRKIKEKMQDLGLKIVLMSGSGSCVFAMSQNKKELKKAMKIFGKNYRVIFTKILK